MRAFASVVLAGAAAAALAQPPRYTITEIARNSREPRFYAEAMNDAGQVVGRTSFPDYVRATRWTDGVTQHYEGLGATTAGYGINRHGHIAGHANVPPWGDAKAALWDDQGFRNLGSLGDAAQARDVNDFGSVVGYSYLPPPNGGSTHGFLYRDGRMIDLGSVGVGIYSEAIKVNNRDVVIGNERTREGGTQSAWIWDDARGIRPIFEDRLGIANDINDLNQVVGEKGRSGFLMQGDQVRFFDRLFWRALNNTGLIVGARALDDFGNVEPVLWYEERAYEINSLIDGSGQLVVGNLLDINDAGQILAEARLPGQNINAYVRLDPVPEPATLLALGVGLAALARRRRSRH